MSMSFAEVVAFRAVLSDIFCGFLSGLSISSLLPNLLLSCAGGPCSCLNWLDCPFYQVYHQFAPALCRHQALTIHHDVASWGAWNCAGLPRVCLARRLFAVCGCVSVDTELIMNRLPVLSHWTCCAVVL